MRCIWQCSRTRCVVLTLRSHVQSLTYSYFFLKNVWSKGSPSKYCSSFWKKIAYSHLLQLYRYKFSTRFFLKKHILIFYNDIGTITRQYFSERKHILIFYNYTGTSSRQDYVSIDTHREVSVNEYIYCQFCVTYEFDARTLWPQFPPLRALLNRRIEKIEE